MTSLNGFHLRRQKWGPNARLKSSFNPLHSARGCPWVRRPLNNIPSSVSPGVRSRVRWTAERLCFCFPSGVGARLSSGPRQAPWERGFKGMGWALEARRGRVLPGGIPSVPMVSFASQVEGRLRHAYMITPVRAPCTASGRRLRGTVRGGVLWRGKGASGAVISFCNGLLPSRTGAVSEMEGARTGFIKSVPRAPNARAGLPVIEMRCSQPIGQNDCSTLPIVFICQKRHPVVKCDACRTCGPAQICFFTWKTTSTDGRFLHIVLRQAPASRPDVLVETTFRLDLQSRAEASGAFPCSLLRFPPRVPDDA